MNLRKNSKVWTALAEASETPKEFIKSVMRLRGESAATLAKKMNHTKEYVLVATNSTLLKLFSFNFCIIILYATSALHTGPLPPA